MTRAVNPLTRLNYRLIMMLTSVRTVTLLIKQALDQHCRRSAAFSPLGWLQVLVDFANVFTFKRSDDGALSPESRDPIISDLGISAASADLAGDMVVSTVRVNCLQPALLVRVISQIDALTGSVDCCSRHIFCWFH